MSTVTDRPDVSIVLDYENLALAGAERFTQVLGSLTRQIREAPFRVELLVPETADTDREELHGLPVRRFHAPPGAHYYDAKNEGVRAAHADVVVFADADATTLDRWLVHLVEPFQDPAVDAVVGNTTIRPVTTLRQRVFAATSWFPADEQDARRHLIANNMAFRRSVFLPDGFPDVGCRYRGAEGDLDRVWAARGVRVELAPEARTQHPPPDHPLRRALWDGHDQLIRQRDTGAAFAPFLARVVLHQLVIGSVRIFRHRRAVGLRRRDLPLALVCNLSEAAERGAGFLLARFAHEAMHRRVLR